MVFIDGATLRHELRALFGHDRIDLHQLAWRELVGLADFNIVHGELIRAYFYDGLVLAEDKEYSDRKKYFDRLRRFDFCEVRLGRLIRLKDGSLRQKGVDVLMALDMVSKAKDDHFDIAVVLANDDDFVDMVQAVRDSGKRVCGAYIGRKASRRLLDVFDRRKDLTKEILEPYMLNEDWKRLVSTVPPA